MGHLANIFGFGATVLTAPSVEHDIASTARLIPGSSNRRARVFTGAPEKKLETVVRSGTLPTFAADGLLDQLLPGLRSFTPATLFQATRDTVLIIAVYVAQSQLKIGIPNSSVLALYILLFLSFANQAKLYISAAQRAGSLIILAKIIFLTTTLTVLALKTAAQHFSLLPLFLCGGLNWLVLSACREPWRSFAVAPPRERRRVMIVGDSSLGGLVVAALRRDRHSFRVVQEFLLDSCLRDPRGAEMMKRIARQECIDEVIIATTDRAVAQIVIREAKRSQLDVLMAPDISGMPVCGVECVQGIHLLKLSEQTLPVWPLALKRCADVLLSSVLLVLLSPLLLLLAVAINVESRGPILYRAVRVGRKAALFHCYKFRTMIQKADELKNEMRAQNQRSGAFFKVKNDPRITRIGGVLRRYSLDELPQLWNVLRGDMSLVGPRPHPADDVQRYAVEDLRRLDFVPGITGLWQVTARQDPSFTRCVELDTEYIRNWSVFLDIRILCRTILAVWQGSGA